jgi:hypothetical protein
VLLWPEWPPIPWLTFCPVLNPADVLKFQHLSQLLLDMNCPLIMVKTFLLQDSVELVKARNEVDDKKCVLLASTSIVHPA